MARRNIRNFVRGKLVDRIDFDPSCPFSTAGGYGEIYRGSLIREARPDGSPHRFCYVALKSMRYGTDDDDDRLAQIIDEAGVWKDLHHPHVLRFLGLLSDVGVTYLVSPFAVHGSLPQYLDLNPDADRPTFLTQMAAGIAYLHEMGIVHGDVKGANVLVFSGPSARICDFGLAKLADVSPSTTQNQVGSWYRMSPERMFGQTRTPASDVYAYGLTIYEILSGSIPFAGLDTVALVQAVHFRGERPNMQPQSSTSGVSYALLWVLAARCWSQSPEERPSMGEARGIIVSGFGQLVDVGDEDLPDVFAPSLPADVTTRTQNRTDSLPESMGASSAGESDERPYSTEKDQTHNKQGSNSAGTRHLLLYKAALGLLIGCLFAWFIRNQRVSHAVPVETTSFAADATQDAWSVESPIRPKVHVTADETLKLGQGLQKIFDAAQGSTIVGFPSAVLPSGPDNVFGRKDYIENVVDRLSYTNPPHENQPTSTPPRLAILGPGGIGKTSVALAAVSDHRVRKIYGDRVHWVPCEQATSPELFVELIARGLGAPKGDGNDRKRDIIGFLQQHPIQPRLLLLDNFETPWDIPNRQTDVNDILFDVVSASPLAILLTMRSDITPSTRIRWTSPTLPPLTALSLPAARELYLDIHEDAESDSDLDILLHELAYMPLAVRLMANRGRLGEMPSALLALWKDERIRIKLLHQGDDRITSIMVSVELSVNSNLMRRNPDALVLLSLLAELPAGVRQEFVQDLAPQRVDIGGALGTLRQAALVQVNPSTHNIQLLSPVRSLILKNHRASPNLRRSLRQAYFDLIEKYKPGPDDTIFLEAMKVLGAETVNIETLLLDALDTEPTDVCIDAAYNYGEFQYRTSPQADVVEKAVGVVRKLGKDLARLSHGLELQARLYRALARNDDAKEAGEQALVIYKQIGNQHGEVNSLTGLAQDYRMMGQYNDAVRVGEQALVICKRIGYQHGEAHNLIGLGLVYMSLNRYEDAMEAAKQALMINKRIANQHGEANSLLGLAQAYKELGRANDAVEVGEEALVIYKRLGDQRGEAKGFTSLGSAYVKMSRYDDAVGAGEQALAICREVGDLQGEANSLSLIGQAYMMMSRSEDAARAGEQASVIYKRIGSQGGGASNLLRLGNVYRTLGRYDDAVGVGEQALVIYRRLGDQHGEAKILAGLVTTFVMMSRYNDAVEVGEQALAIYQQIGEQAGEAQCLFDLGQAYLMLGRSDHAVEVAKLALVIFEQVGDQLGQANVLLNLGAVFRMLGRYNDAVEAGEEALVIYKQIGEQDGELQSLLGLRKAFIELGRYKDVVRTAEQALVVCKRIGDQLEEANSLSVLEQAYRLLGQLNDAMGAGQQGLAIYERLGNQHGEAHSLLGLGTTYLGLRRNDDARRSGERALLIYKQIGDLVGEANSLRIIGWALHSLGRGEEAVKVTSEALKIFRRVRREKEVKECLAFLRTLGVEQ